MNFNYNIKLEDKRVLLRPICHTDAAAFQNIAYEPDTWRFMISRIASETELNTWMQQATDARTQQLRYTFAIIDKACGSIAGSTAYGNISVPDQRLEIGWTWLGSAFRGSDLNRHCKFLLLSYALEVLQFERVEFKTDVLNERSRKALLKIGATEEGILRRHTRMHDGRMRDTIYYSILRPEWQELKERVFPDLTFTF
ncbi:GNAT family N-acetyltransferase [Botryobacter ruber]|uniref:GNAT family N-acetyltransferase n=1 Tax=Botryobacter ruber TaxID=2171629 RepID=UPI000E0C401C|nr:GNAT family protein [Botryobacter ruber]